MTVSNVLDGIFVLIILISVFMAWRRGFVHTVLSFLGFIAAAAVSGYYCGRVAQFFYEKVIAQPLYDSILKKVLTLVPTGEIINKVENIGDVLPGFVTALFNAAAIKTNEQISQTLSGTAEAVARTVCDAVAAPLLLSLLSLVAFFVLFGLLMVIVNILVSVVGKVFELPVLSGINRFLGGIVGVLNGVLLCMVAAAILKLFIGLTGNANGLINTGVLEATWFVTYFVDYNPILSLLS
ncbi:CvpA family protein [Acetanaerobacterium elongatum]|uniref:Colicin V production protein n=1 Tax=Acetanaerobacterium elongatum TaxID=258515 RepID=A0A1G9V824_9FIRM|nr:CvpA family protein [Acetanaerobacterium elongatum]SDM68309.1 Colicin V production protein [Acetanaerobacterium elongatum]